MRRRWLRTSVLVICFVAAASAGYLVSARLGAEALRRTAQDQLATLMQGSVRIGRARLVLRGGLFIEGERVGVYPRSTVPHRPALFASHVSAEIDVLALLTGRFRLNGLLLDEAVLEIRRSPDGLWSPPPFQALADDQRGASVSADMERSLDLFHAFEAVTRTLLEEPLVARRVELRRSRVTFYDEVAEGREGSVRLALYRVNGRLVHHWLSGEADLSLRAALVGPDRRPVSLQAEGRQRDGDEMRLVVTAGGLPLAYVEPYLGTGGARLDGDISGEIAYETRAVAHGSLSLQCIVEGLETTVDVRNGHFEIARPLVQLDSLVEVHPGRIRLARGHLDADGIELDLEGAIERPLSPHARARFEVGVGGLDLEEVREIVRSLPDEDSVTLETVLARLDGGRIDRIGGSGSARLDEWGPLLVGSADRLPRGFVVGAELSGMRTRAGDAGWLSDVGGRIELSGDRLRLEGVSGFWNDEPLPRLALSIHGVSHLFRGSDAERALRAEAGPLPGIGPLWEITRRGPEQPSAPAPRVSLRLERLEHPVLRWPITNALIAMEGTDRGVQLAFEEGRWAGAPFDGEAVWIAGPDESLSVDLRIRRGENEAAAEAAEASTAKTEALPWAEGEFEIGQVTYGPLPFTGMQGRFRIVDSGLQLARLRADLAPTGKLLGEIDLDLGSGQEVGTAFEFTLASADVASLGEAIGWPPGFATGSLSMAGSAKGPLRPQTPLLTSLTGQVRLDARDGEVRRDELPLVLALAQASQGYNEYAARNAIVYEFVRADLLVSGGNVSTQNFELEGPLRVYASGTLDAARPPHHMVGVVGLFLFRGAGQIMETLPLVKAFLPGSEKGLVGAYFQVTGPFETPHVEALTGRSVAEDLPDVLAAPYQLLRTILSGGRPDEGRTTPTPEETAPVEPAAPGPPDG